MSRQLSLGFGNEAAQTSPQKRESRQDEAVAVATRPVEEIAAELRPRVLDFLRVQNQPVGIPELRSQFGYAALDAEPDPQQNPVNRIIKELRDRGEVMCNEGETGEPMFSLPSSEERPSAAAPQLVRRDRQQTFRGEPVEDWPKPKYDPEAITVDRPHDGMDGPAHRFVIRCGDYVEVLVSPDESRIAEALEIGHTTLRVLVRFYLDDDYEEEWFSVERIFPTLERP
jgi:hypothetical protein